MIVNKLHINLEKSCFMHFDPRKRVNVTASSASGELTEPPVVLGGTELLEVDKAKYLGVIIDNKLSWGPHIEHLTKRLRSNAGQLARLRDTVPENHHKVLYHSLFESHLSYGITVWGHVSDTMKRPLKVSQKHCIPVTLPK